MSVKPLTVYVVDDDESIRSALKRLLVSVGFQVLTFESAEDFLDTNFNIEKGCLVLDICLPGMTGFDLQEQLASRRSKIPIIFITAHDNSRWQEKAKNRGSVAYLIKPFREEALLSAIRQCWQQAEESVET